MYDASAKLPSGILQGNINQYGDFDECLAINAVFKNPKQKSEDSSGIQGKYCIANIDVTATNDNIGLQQAVYRSQSFAFVRSKADDVHKSKFDFRNNGNYSYSNIFFSRVISFQDFQL